MTDQSDAIIPGASVKAVHVATNFERQVTTSNEGSYTITQLPVGSYVVIVTVQGFQTTTLEKSRSLPAARCEWTRNFALARCWMR